MGICLSLKYVLVVRGCFFFPKQLILLLFCHRFLFYGFFGVCGFTEMFKFVIGSIFICLVVISLPCV